MMRHVLVAGILLAGALAASTAEAATVGARRAGGPLSIGVIGGRLVIVPFASTAPSGLVGQHFMQIGGVGSANLVNPGPLILLMPRRSAAAAPEEAPANRPACVETTPRGVVVMRGGACER
jgi:hypothetical protein